jgi:hypothetical protein
MASDITLAVGDGARSMAYAELGQLRAVPRPISGNAIATTEFDGSGQAEALSGGTRPETPANGARPDPRTVGALESAVEGLQRRSRNSTKRFAICVVCSQTSGGGCWCS